MKNQFLKTTFFTLALLVSTISFAQTVPNFLPAKQAMENNSDLSSLSNGLDPFIYFWPNNKSIEKFRGDIPLVAQCPASEVTRLYEENIDFVNVKLIRIAIGKPQDLITLDISRLSSFQNLEYVQLVFMYDICGSQSESCLLTKTQQMITGERTVTVLYELAIPQ